MTQLFAIARALRSTATDENSGQLIAEVEHAQLSGTVPLSFRQKETSCQSAIMSTGQLR